MSGGHWDYQGYMLCDILTKIGQDYEVLSKFPILAKILRDLGPVLTSIEHELDWHISCDIIIEDHKKFESEAIAKIKTAIGD